MSRIGLLSADVAPLTRFVARVDRWEAALLALEVDIFQTLEEKQIGDLLNRHQGVGEAGSPKAVPKFVDFFLDMRSKHSVMSLMDQAASSNNWLARLISSSMSCGGNSVSTRPTRESGGSLSAARVMRPWRSTAAFTARRKLSWLARKYP